MTATSGPIYRIALLLIGMGGGLVAELPLLGESNRFESVLEESLAISVNEAERSVELARSAMVIASDSGRLDWELRARARLGDALKFNGQYEEAKRIMKEGLALPRTDATRIERAWLHYEVGRLHWNMSEYSDAEKSFVEVQRVAEDLNDQLLLARVTNSRGIVASHQHQPEIAKEQYESALAMAESVGDDVLRAKILNNLALIIRDEGELGEARELFLANLALHEQSGNQRGMANALINLGSVESAQERHEAALEYNRRSLEIRIKSGVPRHIASAHITVAGNLAKLDRGQESLIHLQAADPIVAEIDSAELSANHWAADSEAHAANGNFQQALQYHHRAEANRLIVAGENTAKTVAELRERYEAEKRQREIAVLQADQREKESILALNAAELRRSQEQRWALLGLLILGGITVLAVIGRMQATARADRRVLIETELAREAAEEATTLKSRLIDVVSHDLKNPLLGIMMTADVIRGASADNALVSERAEAVKAESQQMFGLVQDILDSSAAEAGRIELNRSSLNLVEFVSRSHLAWSDRAKVKDQKINLILDREKECEIEADAGRLRQVVENLVGNALKFSPLGSEITLSLRGGDSVVLSVRDEGPGFSGEDLVHIFRPYAKLSATPTGGESTTGLGLAVAHEMVLLHGGSLEATNAPGGGAIGTATLPRS